MSKLLTPQGVLESLQVFFPKLLAVIQLPAQGEEKSFGITASAEGTLRIEANYTQCKFTVLFRTVNASFALFSLSFQKLLPVELPIEDVPQHVVLDGFGKLFKEAFAAEKRAMIEVLYAAHKLYKTINPEAFLKNIAPSQIGDNEAEEIEALIAKANFTPHEPV